ncbi:MAG: molecular chaperone DnaJ, partial [Betaproteobacteria bacterium]|nr:molecular chaperone DnaJ [Betaproteobacteria bacterium]
SKEFNAEERFKEANEAYETLHDREKRAAYDGLGRFDTGQKFRPPPDWFKRYGAGAREEPDADLSDLFASLRRGFGRDRGGARARGAAGRGEDQEVTVHLRLEEAAHGAEIDLQVSERESRGTRTIRVRVPPGVTDGQKLRLRGKGGMAANGGTAGDLYLNITLHPHPLFKVTDHDLYLELPVAPWEAALGAQIEIPTLEGRVKLKIPPGSSAGQKLRLSGKGMPRPGGGAGDLYAVLALTVPSVLSDRERKLFEELRTVSGFNPRGHFSR